MRSLAARAWSDVATGVTRGLDGRRRAARRRARPWPLPAGGVTTSVGEVAPDDEVTWDGDEVRGALADIFDDDAWGDDDAELTDPEPLAWTGAIHGDGDGGRAVIDAWEAAAARRAPRPESIYLPAAAGAAAFEATVAASHRGTRRLVRRVRWRAALLVGTGFAAGLLAAVGAGLVG